ncbi:MAG: diguanylate cyclase [Erysipelotrichaceae bacterium]|nr:MAG: diguanylate [Erysipelotrichaceae bacterium]TXT18026.1 MAG: diguanylate cyclase [Erysipelotrichaceae bacterium]
MGLNVNFALNAYSIIILFVLLFHSIKQSDKNSLQFKLYFSIITITLLSLIFDSLARLDGQPNTILPILNHVGNFTIFLVSPILPSIWILYIHDEIFHDGTMTKRLVMPLFLVFGINAIFLIISQFTHWYYFIDAQNIYQRGPFFIISALFTILLMLFAFLMIIKNKKKIDSKHYNALLLFAVPPFLAIFVSLVFYGISLMLNSTVLSIMIISLYIQNQDLNTDYLTKVNNRKRIDQYMEEKIRISSKGRTFATIMIDLENFKIINDHFGHDAGDQVLREAAQLLKSCLRSVDFIGRYGGDEFYIVLDVSQRSELMTVVDRINSRLKKYNCEKALPNPLVMSLGYDVYDASSKMTLEEFQKHIDHLMYRDKEVSRSKNVNFASGR